MEVSDESQWRPVTNAEVAAFFRLRARVREREAAKARSKPVAAPSAAGAAARDGLDSATHAALAVAAAGFGGVRVTGNATAVELSIAQKTRERELRWLDGRVTRYLADVPSAPQTREHVRAALAALSADGTDVGKAARLTVAEKLSLINQRATASVLVYLCLGDRAAELPEDVIAALARRLEELLPAADAPAVDAAATDGQPVDESARAGASAHPYASDVGSTVLLSAADGPGAVHTVQPPPLSLDTASSEQQADASRTRERRGSAADVGHPRRGGSTDAVHTDARAGRAAADPTADDPAPPMPTESAAASSASSIAGDTSRGKRRRADSADAHEAAAAPSGHGRTRARK